MRLPQPHSSQIEVTGKTAIIDLNVPGLQMLQLLTGQSHFAQGAGFQSRVPARPVEHIIDDRQARLRIAGAGGPVLIGDGLPAKRLPQFVALRQTHQGTVEAHESVSTPASDRMLRVIEGG